MMIADRPLQGLLGRSFFDLISPGAVSITLNLRNIRRRVRSVRVRQRMPYRDIDEYIAAYPAEVQEILQKIRALIRTAVPAAGEKISYGIPTFTLNGNLIHFAAFKHHIGMYPPVAGDDKLDAALARYRGEKGNLRFPLDEPIPYNLIRRVVKARVHEQSARSAAKAKRTPKRP
jgi:uncharacterized protein YdhG (YjbR/CyaY superfamily)